MPLPLVRNFASTVCIVGAAACVAPVFAASAGDNLIANGDFHLVPAELPRKPLRWAINVENGAEVTTETGGEGGPEDLWARMSVTADKGSVAVLRCFETGVEPGTRYRLRFAFQEKSSPPAFVRIRLLSSLGDRDPSLASSEAKTLGALKLPIKDGRVGTASGLEAVVSQGAGKNGWSQVTVEFDALWEAVAVDVRIALTGGGRAGAIGFDNFELLPATH